MQSTTYAKFALAWLINAVWWYRSRIYSPFCQTMSPPFVPGHSGTIQGIPISSCTVTVALRSWSCRGVWWKKFVHMEASRCKSRYEDFGSFEPQLHNCTSFWRIFMDFMISWYSHFLSRVLKLGTGVLPWETWQTFPMNKLGCLKRTSKFLPGNRVNPLSMDKLGRNSS